MVVRIVDELFITGAQKVPNRTNQLSKFIAMVMKKLYISEFVRSKVGRIRVALGCRRLRLWSHETNQLNLFRQSLLSLVSKKLDIYHENVNVDKKKRRNIDMFKIWTEK